MRSVRQVAGVWVLLVALTLVAVVESGRSDPGSVVAASVLAATMVKAALILFGYMEVRDGPWWLRLACGAWIVAVAATIAGLTLVG